LCEGFDGGRDAARQLFALSSKSLKLLPSTRVVIHVFASVPTLAVTLCQASIIPKADFLNEFVNGFNSVDEMATFINVGRGKELTDAKINGTITRNF
jgi:hypothetical protein